MQSQPTSFARRLLTAPDPQLADAGFAGELFIAGLRLLVAAALALVLMTQYLAAPYARRWQLLLGAGGVALLQALLLYAAAGRRFGRSWIGFASSMVDVSLVSGGILLLQHLRTPAAVDLLFPAYFLAMGATSLRYDARVCLASGALMLLQYSAIGLLTGEALPLWQSLGRSLLLLAAVLLSTTIAARARELRALSILDRLTGLSNRGYFEERLRKEEAAARRASIGVTVVMLDIDHFKRFNDSFGHAGGDRALVAVADLLRRSFRSSDVISRYGGEEIALILPGMSAEDAFRRLEVLRQTLSCLPIDLPGVGTVHLTASIGVATWPRDGESLGAALATADARLYRAKGDGRNQVVGPLADGSTPPGMAGRVGLA